MCVNLPIVVVLPDPFIPTIIRANFASASSNLGEAMDAAAKMELISERTSDFTSSVESSLRSAVDRLARSIKRTAVCTPTSETTNASSNSSQNSSSIFARPNTRSSARRHALLVLAAAVDVWRGFRSNESNGGVNWRASFGSATPRSTDVAKADAADHEQSTAPARDPSGPARAFCEDRRCG